MPLSTGSEGWRDVGDRSEGGGGAFGDGQGAGDESSTLKVLMLKAGKGSELSET